MKHIKIITILFIAVLTAACSRPGQKDGGYSASIQIKGSDTIINLIQVWAERFVEQHPSYNIGVTGGGSGTGFAGLINGTCDIAISSREIEDKELALAKSKNVAAGFLQIPRSGKFISRTAS